MHPLLKRPPQRTGSPQFARRAKMLIIEDDPDFRRLLLTAANPARFKIDAFESLADMGSFAMIAGYDLAVIDQGLPVMAGLEIAEYIDFFYDTVPVVLMSAQPLTPGANKPLPPCVRAFVEKSQGALAILQASEAALTQPRFGAQGAAASLS